MPSNEKCSRIRYLFKKYVEDTATAQEIKEFLELFEGEEDNALVQVEIRRFWHKLKEKHAISDKELSLDRLHREIALWEKKTNSISPVYLRGAVAAVIFALLGLSLYFLYAEKSVKIPSHAVATTTVKNNIVPGGNKAVLTLANGTKIILDSTQKGTIATQGSIKVIKLNNGLLTYNTYQGSKKQFQKLKVRYNTISTPQGGQYQVVLSDGTKVWLNAASSIRFPNIFAGKERKVSITGEVYFEVAENERKPFKVGVNGLNIKVLGTHFNVMAYDNEPATKVALLQGAVRVTKAHQQILLKQGEEVQLDQTGRMRKVKVTDLQGVIAWKNNQFWFNNDDIQAVMHKLSRWYDVDIVIKGNIPEHFDGFIPRNIEFSKVFSILQKTSHLHYKIKDGQVIVLP